MAPAAAAPVIPPPPTQPPPPLRPVVVPRVFLPPVASPEIGPNVQAAVPNALDAGEFYEREIMSLLRMRRRAETEPLVLELSRQFNLTDNGRRLVRAALDRLEARGALRRGPNYVALPAP